MRQSGTHVVDDMRVLFARRGPFSQCVSKAFFFPRPEERRNLAVPGENLIRMNIQGALDVRLDTSHRFGVDVGFDEIILPRYLSRNFRLFRITPSFIVKLTSLTISLKVLSHLHRAKLKIRRGNADFLHLPRLISYEYILCVVANFLCLPKNRATRYFAHENDVIRRREAFTHCEDF